MNDMVLPTYTVFVEIISGHVNADSNVENCLWWPKFRDWDDQTQVLKQKQENQTFRSQNNARNNASNVRMNHDAESIIEF